MVAVREGSLQCVTYHGDDNPKHRVDVNKVGKEERVASCCDKGEGHPGHHLQHMEWPVPAIDACAVFTHWHCDDYDFSTSCLHLPATAADLQGLKSYRESGGPLA